MEWIGFVVGLIVGSFLNVCIHRLPQSMSIVRPGSRCPQCGRPIRPRDNIPLVSYLLLRGRCRDCGGRIPWRYPLVEVLTGAFGALSVMRFGFGATALVVFVLVCALLVVTFIDLDHRIIPDAISLPGILLGLAVSFGPGLISPLESLGGALLGGGVLFLVAWGYQRLAGREGMGGGDIKLLAMIGAFLGWKGVAVTLFIASLSGTIAGLAVMLRRTEGMRAAVPFGPFLAIGAIAYLFRGPELVRWYLGTMG